MFDFKILIPFAELYSESWKTSKMKLLAKIFNDPR